MDMNMSPEMGATLGFPINYAFSRDYWYIVAGVVGSLAAINAINHYGATQRLKACNNPSIKHPTRPDGRLSQAWATATATVREIGHPQLYVPIKGLRWATPPPLGRVIVLLCYWGMMVYFMTWRSIKHDINFYERLGFRNAWMTIMQLPMLYLLSMKFNIIGYLIGSSHERLNWLHRWVARTMFVTATVHGFTFFTEWVNADFVTVELEMLPLVKYGLGAWAILLWSIVVGFLPVRRMAYEFWVAQHVVSAVLILWLLSVHIPAKAKHFLWLSVSFLVFDRAARWLLLLWQNVRLKPSSGSCHGTKRIGHNVSARAVGDSTTVLVVKDVQFTWKAGQHVYLWVPWLGPIEAHPYTIACAHSIKGTCCCNSIQFIIRKHQGFSKRVHDFATKNPDGTLTGFLSGPYGAPPRWDIYENLVLIGASTGASFTVPLLESVAHSTEKTCVKRIDVVLLAKTASEVEYYVQRTRESGRLAREKGIDVRLHLAITGRDQGEKRSSGVPLVPLVRDRQNSDSSSIEGADTHSSRDEKRGDYVVDVHARRGGSSLSGSSVADSSSSVSASVREYTSRPDIEALIREPVEAALGETAVVVCGGPEVVARTRNCVSQLSDERAVHKGTGAQGIYLHVEEYAF